MSALARNGWTRALLAVALSVALSNAATGVAGARSSARSSAAIEVSEAWARTSPMTATNGAVYMVIENRASKENALVSASVAPSVAAEAQIHETRMGEGGTRSMAEVSEIILPAASTVALEPGGYHIMLVGLAAPLETGARIKVTLAFERGRKQTVKAVVKP